MEECKLQIQTNFLKSPNEYVDFSVELIQENLKSLDEMGKKGEKKKQKEIPEDSDLITIQPFFITKQKIRIRKGDTVTYTVQFLPFEMKTCSCKIIFFDPLVGEIQHEIIGEVQLPDITSEFKVNQIVYVDQKVNKDFVINFKNEQLLSALKIHEQRVVQFNRQKEKEDLMRKR